MDQNQYTNAGIFKPRYVGFPQSMYEFASNALPYKPEPEQAKKDSADYAGMYKAVVANPELYNEDKAKQRMVDIANEDINMRPEEDRRKDYIKAGILHGAISQGKEDTDRYNATINSIQLKKVNDIISQFTGVNLIPKSNSGSNNYFAGLIGK